MFVLVRVWGLQAFDVRPPVLSDPRRDDRLRFPRGAHTRVTWQPPSQNLLGTRVARFIWGHNVETIRAVGCILLLSAAWPGGSEGPGVYVGSGGGRGDRCRGWMELAPHSDPLPLCRENASSVRVMAPL